MVTGARGKLAGSIFSANKGGPYVKGWARSSNPRTPAQVTVRNRMAGFSTSWADLTQAQRDDWDDYADDPPQELTNSLGETYFISGHAWYVRINSHLAEASESSRVDAPTLTRPVAPVLSDFTTFKTSGSNNSFLRLTVGSAGLSSNILLTTRLFYSVGRQSATSGFRHTKIDVPNAGRFIGFQGEIESLFGTIPEDVKIFGVISIQDAHGQRGPVDTANDVTAA